jgi:hypothetical protein
MGRLQALLEALSAIDRAVFEERYFDTKYLEKKRTSSFLSSNRHCSLLPFLTHLLATGRPDARREIPAASPALMAPFSHSAISTFGAPAPSPAPSPARARSVPAPAAAPDRGLVSFFGGGDDEEGEEGDGWGEGGTMAAEFRQHKRNYYLEKMGRVADDTFLLEFARVRCPLHFSFVRLYFPLLSWRFSCSGIRYWVAVGHALLLPGRAVVGLVFSFCLNSFPPLFPFPSPAHARFFPSHYAPYVSDVCRIASFLPTFDLGTPFLPFQQVPLVFLIFSHPLPLKLPPSPSNKAHHSSCRCCPHVAASWCQLHIRSLLFTVCLFSMSGLPQRPSP